MKNKCNHLWEKEYEDPYSPAEGYHVNPYRTVCSKCGHGFTYDDLEKLGKFPEIEEPHLNKNQRALLSHEARRAVQNFLNSNTLLIG